VRQLRSAGADLARDQPGDLQVGALVNIERALAAGARLGGHFVQGHVDGTVRILTWQAEGADWRLEVELPAEARGLVIPKGSICLDGISLTAADVTADRVTCWIIPHTREVTHLSARRVGQRMNVEWDMLAKHVREIVRAELAAQFPGSISRPRLQPKRGTRGFGRRSYEKSTPAVHSRIVFSRVIS